MLHVPLLSIIIFLPLVGGFLALATGSRWPLLCRWIGLTTTLLELSLVSSLLFLGLQPQAGPTGVWLLMEDYPWITSLGVRYSLGLDGLSLLLLLLTAFINVLCILVSWRAITTKVGSFHFFLLFLEASVMGLFMATDLLLFYLFWEIQIIPMFFLVGIWGHERRVYAAVKFVLFTLCGSLLMLIALVALYVFHGQQTGVYTFASVQLMHTQLSFTTEILLYSAFMLAFAIKIPIVPLHTWLPDAHTQAPTAGSLDLAGLLLKTGFYGFFRFAFPLFPLAAQASIPVLIALGLGGMFYTSWIALAQTDIKRLVAYSSIGHMGLMVVGIAVWNLLSMTGSLLQMVNHGLSTSALFIMVGMIGERIDSREFADLGGLWGKMPVFSVFFLFFAMASMGLPGLNNFVGEVLLLVGIFEARPLIGILSFGGLIFTVIYILRMVKDTLFGEPKKDHVWVDVNAREVVILVLMALPFLFIGVHPGPALRLLDQPVQRLLEQVS
ncbi:MAG: NADH-quinone oxidoreductase subunit M, partial [Desulfobaccales bacterium]